MNLKMLRTQRGISQKEVADSVGCSPTVYSRYETGERQPSIEMLISLSKFFGVSVDCIIGNPETAMPSFTDTEMELLLAAREADERAAADALRLLRSHPSHKRNSHKKTQ